MNGNDRKVSFNEIRDSIKERDDQGKDCIGVMPDLLVVPQDSGLKLFLALEWALSPLSPAVLLGWHVLFSFILMRQRMSPIDFLMLRFTKIPLR